jgi:hypothetical protein
LASRHTRNWSRLWLSSSSVEAGGRGELPNARGAMGRGRDWATGVQAKAAGNNNSRDPTATALCALTPRPSNPDISFLLSDLGFGWHLLGCPGRRNSTPSPCCVCQCPQASSDSSIDIGSACTALFSSPEGLENDLTSGRTIPHFTDHLASICEPARRRSSCYRMSRQATQGLSVRVPLVCAFWTLRYSTK